MSGVIDEKKVAVSGDTPPSSMEAGFTGDVMDPVNDDDFEVFKKNTDGVQFRTVEWPRASVIFLKGIDLTPTLSDSIV